MIKEIKPESAEVIKIGGIDRTMPRDIEEVRSDLLKLANDIDKIADKTRWPRMCKDKAARMREFANDLRTP